MSVNWMRMHHEWGVFDPASEEPGFGSCLWNVEARNSFKSTPNNGARTLVEALTKSKDLHGDRRAVGWRQLIKVHEVEEGGAKREKLELANEYQWLSYREYYERVLGMARGLSLLGVEPQSRVVIYAETQRDWMVAAFAAFHSSAQVVTVYATLGPDGAAHGINETEAQTVVADAKLLKILLKLLPKCPSVKNIITMTPCDGATAEQAKAAGVELFTIEELIEKGKTWSFSPRLPSPEDVAVIMYTSGTTGPPKGVVLSHGNIAAVIAGVEHDLQGAVTHEDVYLAYLPLAHIMEMAAEICFFSMGCAIGFGSPHTLTTDSGQKLKKPESLGDAPVLQPTFLVAAPAVLDKIYQGIQRKRAELGHVGQALFRWGLNSGERHFNRNRIGANRLFNLIFKKVQRAVGGKLKGLITGSAPLSADIQKYIQTVLDIPVRQGYGLTETCAGSCVAFWGDNTAGSVGPPTVSAVIRLADWPEGNYLNSDKEKPEIGMPRGEVLIGGPAVSLGYFVSPARPNRELEKKNEEDWVTIKGVRFFRTGDIGQIRPNGTLQIIDRKKDLWKGPNGEYVALTKVEGALTMCEFVELSMCYGRTGGAYPVALVCPQRRRLEALAQELGVTGDFAALCGFPQLVERVTEACRATCREQKLVDFEIPKKVVLVSELWTPENGMLTAANKLKRPVIVEANKEAIDKLYA